MAGGWLVGLGQGISKAGDIYANAKEQAIQRMFRDRQLALQQQQLQAQISQNQSNDAFRVMGALPADTQVDLDQFGPGGAATVRAFSKETQVPDQTAPTLGARSIATPITGAPTMDVSVPPTEPGGVMASQDLSPKVTKRVSIPTADTKLRSAELTAMNRERIAARSDATRRQIAEAKMALAEELAHETNAIRRVQLQQGMQRLNLMDRAITQQGAYQGAQINNMDIDNARQDAVFEAGGQGAGINPFMALLAPQLAASMGGPAAPVGPTGGAVGAIPGAPPQKPRVAPKHGSVRDAPGASPSNSAYQEYLRRQAEAAKGQ